MEFVKLGRSPPFILLLKESSPFFFPFFAGVLFFVGGLFYSFDITFFFSLFLSIDRVLIICYVSFYRLALNRRRDAYHGNETATERTKGGEVSKLREGRGVYEGVWVGVGMGIDESKI